MIPKKSIFINFAKYFILIIVIPILVIGIASNEMYMRSLINNLSKQASLNTHQLAFYLNDTLQKISISLKTLSNYNDYEIPNLISKYKKENSETNIHTGSAEIDKKLSTLINYFDCVEAIIFYYPNEGYYYYKSNLLSGDWVIRDTYWYRDCLKEPQKIIASRMPSEAISTEQYKFYATFSMALNTSGIEAVSIVLNENLFQTVYEKIKENYSDDIIISDYKGIIISQGSGNMASLPRDILTKVISNGNNYFMHKLNNKDSIVTYANIAVTDWILISFSDLATLKYKSIGIFQIFLIVFVVALGIFLFVFYKFIKNILSPVKELSAAIKKVEGGNFNISLNTNWGSYEFDNLSTAFLNMSRRIGTLVKEIDKKEETKRILEIRALQYQINPHFIKNTLNSIRLLAMVSNMNQIKNMSESLSNLLSSSIEDESIFTSVKTELQLLEDYICIMKIRYQDQFEVFYNIEPSILKYKLLKKTLQPVVENSIFHGMGSKDTAGIIEISGYETEDELVLVVYDNGDGISSEMINKLENRHPSIKSIGLFNVMERIKLNYGECYGLTFESEMNKYTKIIIKLPKVL